MRRFAWGLAGSILAAAALTAQEPPSRRQAPRMPNLVGSEVGEATGTVRHLGLQVAANPADCSRFRGTIASARAGTVIEQSPEAGTPLTRKTRVRLTYCGPEPTTGDDTAPPESVSVPNVIDVPLTTAMTTIRGARLTPAVDLFDALRHRDRPVEGQTPQAGTRVPVGFPVRLVVLPLPRYRVPDLAGLLLAPAQDSLRATGLVADRRVDQADQPQPAGTVVTQRPRAGSLIDSGGSVRLTVSRGVSAPPTMPRVTGMTPAQAKRELRRTGIARYAVDTLANAGPPPWTVLDQRPPPGAPVTPSERVAIVVGRVRATAAVPDLTGLTVAEAAERLAPRLVLGRQSSRDDPNAAGTIVGQQPPGDAVVDSGTAVDVVIASGPHRVRVPDLINRPIERATALLADSGLALGRRRGGGSRRSTA